MSDNTSEHPPAEDPETGEAATDDRGAHGDGRPTDQEPGTAASDAEKDPETWVTGGEPATGPQRSYLSTLTQEAGEQLPDDLSKAKASEEIDRLQGKTGRGQGS